MGDKCCFIKSGMRFLHGKKEIKTASYLSFSLASALPGTGVGLSRGLSTAFGISYAAFTGCVSGIGLSLFLAETEQHY